jgi:hypothetical protein
MDLEDAKYTSMFILFASNLIMTFIALCLHRFIIQRKENSLSITERIISCVTSGILLGKF